MCFSYDYFVSTETKMKLGHMAWHLYCCCLPRAPPNDFKTHARRQFVFFRLYRFRHPFECQFPYVRQRFRTFFIDLELEPAPNHGKWFASFSRVRRLRSASAMTFEFLCGITCKSTSGAYSFTLLMVKTLKKLPFSNYFFIHFSCFLKIVPWGVV